jgi:hypothetical protein
VHVQPVNHIGQWLMVCLGLVRYHARKCLTLCAMQALRIVCYLLRRTPSGGRRDDLNSNLKLSAQG